MFDLKQEVERLFLKRGAFQGFNISFLERSVHLCVRVDWGREQQSQQLSRAGMPWSLEPAGTNRFRAAVFGSAFPTVVFCTAPRSCQSRACLRRPMPVNVACVQSRRHRYRSRSRRATRNCRRHRCFRPPTRICHYLRCSVSQISDSSLASMCSISSDTSRRHFAEASG